MNSLQTPQTLQLTPKQLRFIAKALEHFNESVISEVGGPGEYDEVQQLLKLVLEVVIL